MTEFAAQEHKFPLLKLPPEFRNRIDEYALICDGKVVVSHWHWENVAHRWRPRSLLCTSRKIQNEASSVYYGRNIFVIRSDSRPEESETFCDRNLIQWLEALGRYNRPSLRTIYLDDLWYDEASIVPRIQKLLAEKLVPRRVSVLEQALFLELDRSRFLGTLNQFWVNVPWALANRKDGQKA